MSFNEDMTKDYGDIVQNKYNGVVGKVIGVFYNNGRAFLDVRTDKRVYSYSPEINWELLPEGENDE